MTQWLALSHNGEKVLGSIKRFLVGPFCVKSVLAWVSFGCSGFLQQSKRVHICALQCVGPNLAQRLSSSGKRMDDCSNISQSLTHVANCGNVMQS